MKKTIFLGILAIACMLIGFTSCDPKAKKQEKCENAEAVCKLNASRVTSTDLEYMFANYGGDYRWFEQCVLLKDYLDDDCDGTIEGVSNVFQVVDADSGGFDTHVILCAHNVNGESTVEVKHGFWVDDFVLNNESITISFEQAFDRIIQSNYPKPHSKHCVLRKQIGPNLCNPQYIFGNVRSQLYVDAMTGDVTDKNPVFDGYLGCPLGEWP